VGLVAAGQLVTVFTLSYAFSSPILTALTGGIARRKLLILSIAGFAIANVVAALATGYWMLMAARILLALAAGLTFRTRTRLRVQSSLLKSAARRFRSSLAAPRSRSRLGCRSAP